jgi:RNA polymerase sigma-70 factor (ECF subfamily)
LVLDFQAGNEGDAFDEIHRRYSGLARHVCRNILRNPDDADDATQEVMLRVYQGLHRFNGRYAVQPWVARIATNVSLDVVRSRRRRPVSDRPIEDLAEVIDIADHGLEHEVERRLERERVGRTLAELPRHHRQALVLRAFDGRSHEEIGEALGVTPPQAKALINRAKKSFKRVWGIHEDGRHGLAALAPLFLVPFRPLAWLRRLIHPMHEAASAAAASPAAPAASATASSMAERATAAAVAVLITGTAAIGAATLRQDERARPEPPTPSTRVVAEPVAPALGPRVARRPHGRPKPGHERDETRVAQTLPVGAEDPSLTETATSAPSATPSEEPSADPSPVIADPPEFTLGFQAQVASSSRCDCSGGEVVSSEVSGDADNGYVFDQSYRGAALDADGHNAWIVDVRYSGSTAPGGRLDATFTLTGSDGTFSYTAVGLLAQSLSGDDGMTVYRFGGSYVVSDEVAEGVQVPTSGQLGLLLRFSQDRTLAAADFVLYAD